MTMGKKLVVLGAYAAGACIVFLMLIAAPAVSDVLYSGKSVCIPGWSIRCHETDCGTQFLRCGRSAAEEVPDQNVCYQGTIVPVERTDLHSCPFLVETPRNTTQRPSGLLQCQACTSICNMGGIKVRCSSTGRVYGSQALANCCGATGCHIVSSLSADPNPGFWGTVQLWTAMFTELITFQDVEPTPIPGSLMIDCCNNPC